MSSKPGTGHVRRPPNLGSSKEPGDPAPGWSWICRIEFDRFLRNFRVVTPLDLRRSDVRGRADSMKRKIEELRAEGPHAYKGIRPIIDTLAAAQIAKPVAELVPVATVKG